MKKKILVIVVCLITTGINAQNVENELKKKYNFVHFDYDWNKYKIEKKGKEGICDASGNIIIKPIWDHVYYDKNTNTYEITFNGKKGIIDGNGKLIIRPKYEELFVDKGSKTHYLYCWYFVKRNGKWGACNYSGKEIIQPIYGGIFYDDSGCFFIWEYDSELNDDNIPFRELHDYGIMDTTGRLIFPPHKYSQITGREEGYYVDNSSGQRGFCDKNGKLVIPTNYYFIHFYDSCIVCDYESKGLNHDVYSLTWNKILSFQRYNEVWDISEGLIEVKKNNKYGFVNVKTGEEVIPCIYDEASLFKNGVARVSKDGVSTLISNPLIIVAENNQPKVKGKAVSTYPAPDSEVDKNIPMGKKSGGNTHAFIIVNENYPVAKVPYALNDGWTFEKYCKQTLGIKEENVHLFEDATGGNIMACVEQMKQVAKAAGGNATIIFYYAGHAFPDEERATAYLLPIDGDSKNTATGYSLEKLYKELNEVSAKQIICFIDACFSGSTRDDQMLIAGRGVAIKVKDEIPQGNMVVMTSATGAETAHSYEEMHHGLFTYYLLEKLQHTKGDVSLGELSEYVTKMVKRKSVLINQKKQTPTVIPSPKQQTTWQDIRL